MRTRSTIISTLWALIFLPLVSYADNTPNTDNVIDKNVQQEQLIINNPLSITPYKQNYLLPFYYTGRPDHAVYDNNTPDGQDINPYELKFQLSFKVPVWQNMFGSRSSLFAAYSQMSYWQAYNTSPFFRETDYEPELFIANYLDWSLLQNWRLNFVNVGAEHQSNGEGGDMERSWNRVYLEALLANTNWVVSVKPWWIVHDSSLESHNPDIGRYMGYGRLAVDYKYHEQVFSLEARNVFESDFQRGALTGSWSFPLTTHIDGYVQAFSGYGQSLIEYDHFTNSFGLGFALKKWA